LVLQHTYAKSVIKMTTFIKNFTGIDDPYEAPIEPELVLDTDKYDVNACVAQCVQLLEARGILKK